MGIPTEAQRDQLHLCSTRTQVQSLAQHSGLRNPAVAQVTTGLRSDPWPGNSIYCRVTKKKKKKKERKKRKRIKKVWDEWQNFWSWSEKMVHKNEFGVLRYEQHPSSPPLIPIHMLQLLVPLGALHVQLHDMFPQSGKPAPPALASSCFV